MSASLVHIWFASPIVASQPGESTPRQALTQLEAGQQPPPWQNEAARTARGETSQGDRHPRQEPQQQAAIQVIVQCGADRIADQGAQCADCRRTRESAIATSGGVGAIHSCTDKDAHVRYQSGQAP